MISSHLISCSIASTFIKLGRYILIFARLAAGLCRQAQTRDDKAGAWVDLGRSIPLLSHTSSRHGQPCRALDPTYPSPRSSPLGAEDDDDGKLDSHVKRECDLKGHIPNQRDVKPNEHSSSRMAIFSRGTTNAHGWYVSRSNSRYVAFFRALFSFRACQAGPLAKRN